MHANVFAHQPAQQLLESAYDPVQIQILRLQDLLPAEGQQLPNECGSPLARVIYALDVIAQRGLAFRSLTSEFCVALDDRQKIIEIVCNSSGQSSNCFHPPR